MIEQKHNINWVTFLLAWVAGFCDTATFIAGDTIFSAHVTGNFITFAAQTIHGGASWVKLLTFPVFVVAVMAGGWLSEKWVGRYRILLIEGILLILAGTLPSVLKFLPAMDEKTALYGIVMTTVFGMGLQNAFGKLFAKETHGPTTMMTGNVTQASLDLGSVLRKGIKENQLSWTSLGKQSVTIGGFLIGCLLGAWLAKIFGLSVMVLPGFAIIVCYLQGEISKTQSAD